MAIAYFIPDQTKLLAAGNANTQSSQHQTNSAPAATGNAPSPQGVNTATDNSQFQHQQHQHQQQQHQTQNQNFRANITIPLPAYVSAAASSENVGCWDLITQVFCHALRFCHETRLSPAVIEISFEFNGGLQQQLQATTGSGLSTSATQTVGATEASVTVSSTTTTTPRTPSPTTAVGNASSNTVVMRNTVATLQLDNNSNGSVTTVVQRSQTVERGTGERTHRSAAPHRSGTTRRN